MHDGMPYDRNQGQGQGHSREVDRQSPTGLIFKTLLHSRSAERSRVHSAHNEKTKQLLVNLQHTLAVLAAVQKEC